MEDTIEYDWPGWRLNENPYEKEFDLDARKRMVEGSRELLPLVERWRNHLGEIILETGPFFHPLVEPKNFPGKIIAYWDNDQQVLNYLAEKQPQTVIQCCDLNKVRESSLRLREELEKKVQQFQAGNGVFNSIVASHLLNYIDYGSFLRDIREFLADEGLLFINNSVDYGLSPFFSPKRPRSNSELLTALEDAGFTILEKRELNSQDPRYQPHTRLLVVARR